MSKLSEKRANHLFPEDGSDNWIPRPFYEEGFNDGFNEAFEIALQWWRSRLFAEEGFVGVVAATDDFINFMRKKQDDE